jgi:hormone-sensitive lipase
MRLSDSRFIHKIIDLTLKKIEVVKPFEISPGKLGVLSRDKNELIDVPIPKSHIGLQNIKCRLLSGKMRDGMIGMELDCTTFSVEEPSDSIVIHVHGGGWISQCSKSHEVYLREWTTELDVPILSIDYTLAPEATFPRPVEEVLYVYCWVLKNAEMVGTTAKKIILAGDSAGGNIVTAVLIKIIEMNLPKPHGLFVAYTPFLVNYCKSPSRFFGYFDAFLNVTAVMKIFGCYCNGKLLDNQSIEKEIGNEIDDSLKKIICDIPKDYLISPLWCPDEILQQFPPTRAVTSTTDPCLDDCIEFCRRLRNLKIQTKLTVLEGLMHGFLNTVTVRY